MFSGRDGPNVHDPKRGDGRYHRARWMPLHIEKPLLGTLEHAHERSFFAVPHIDVVLCLLCRSSNDIIATVRECACLAMQEERGTGKTEAKNISEYKYTSKKKKKKKRTNERAIL